MFSRDLKPKKGILTNTYNFLDKFKNKDPEAIRKVTQGLNLVGKFSGQKPIDAEEVIRKNRERDLIRKPIQNTIGIVKDPSYIDRVALPPKIIGWTKPIDRGRPMPTTGARLMVENYYDEPSRPIYENDRRIRPFFGLRDKLIPDAYIHNQLKPVDRNENPDPTERFQGKLKYKINSLDRVNDLSKFQGSTDVKPIPAATFSGSVSSLPSAKNQIKPQIGATAPEN